AADKGDVATAYLAHSAGLMARIARVLGKLQDSEPSWLVMIDRGATTMWERWNGVDADGVPHESLNHYSKGAVISFLHRYTAGIELLDHDEPAYRRFRIQPRPGGGLTSAEAAHESPYGRIESAWEVSDGEFRLGVTVPAGTRADVVLPDGRSIRADPGKHLFTSIITMSHRQKAIAR
ncbi:MAG: alpha-L-rhamnosidase C-terminal domain-containing protein, partial [Nakamurella sp.]